MDPCQTRRPRREEDVVTYEPFAVRSRRYKPITIAENKPNRVA